MKQKNNGFNNMLRGSIISAAIAVGVVAPVQQQKAEASGIRIGFVDNGYGNALDIGGWMRGFAGNLRLGNIYGPRFGYVNRGGYWNGGYNQSYCPYNSYGGYNQGYYPYNSYYSSGALQYQALATAQAEAQAVAAQAVAAQQQAQVVAEQAAQQRQAAMNAALAAAAASPPNITQSQINKDVYGSAASDKTNMSDYLKQNNTITPPGFILPAGWQHNANDIKAMLNAVETKGYIKRYGDGEKTLGKGVSWESYLSAMLRKATH